MGYNLLKENLSDGGGLGTRNINKSLRKWFDRDDPIRMAFHYGGFQRNGGPRGGRQTPAWTRDMVAIRRILLTSFPKLHANSRQHEAALRWALIIRMYWGLGYTHGEIVLDLNQGKWGQENSPELWTLNKVRSVIHRIRRAAEVDARHRGRVPHNPAEGKPRVWGWIEDQDGNRIDPRALEIPVHKLGRPRKVKA
jgi:hypothetical protein